MSPSTLAGDPPCPPAVGERRRWPAPARCARSGVPFDDDPARQLGRARRPQPVGDAVLALGLPPRVVGRVRRERPRGDARRRPGRRPRPRGPDRDRPAHAPPRGGARRRGARDQDPQRRGPPADARPARRQGAVLRRPRTTPTTRRSCATAPRRDLPGAPPTAAGADYCAGRTATRPPAPWDAVDLRRLRSADPALAALTAAFGSREASARWTRELEREDVCPVDDAARRARPSTTTSARSARRRATRSGARSAARRPPARSRSTTRPTRSRTSRRSSTSTSSAGASTGCSPTRPAGRRAGCSSGACSSCSGRRGPLRLAFLTVGGTRIAAGISFETEDAILYYNAGVDPDARELSPGVRDGRAVRAPRPGARPRADGLPARRRALQVRVGRPRRADPAPARPTDGPPMTPPLPWDRCLAPMVHAPVPGPDRVRVVQVLATGTNGGAQEHVFNLVSRLDPALLRRLDRVALERERRPQAPAGRVRRHGHRLARRRDRDGDARRAPRGRPRRRDPQPHVPRRDRGHEGRDRPRRGGPPAARG